jgi:hypothetical protein
MSKTIEFPDGKTGIVSDTVAAILLGRKGHKLAAPEPKKPEAAKPAEGKK